MVLLAALVAAALLVAGAAASPDKTLVVEDANSGDRLLEIPVDEGDEVTLSYTHSVEKTPIQDIYVVGDAELRMDRMIFHSHGAGLPSDADIEKTDEGFVLYLDDTYEELRVSPGSIAGHELVVGDERYDLVEPADRSVVISIEDRGLVDGIFGSVGDRNR
ncbi:DUF1850 domain-containing protein [Natronorubrum sp. DTA7]|uniref:DUF1850 domain-containing protein n=1 Tax=Natronorubrum sp. DTA7 TaxID=3447016 RepID=UPI003F83D1C1